MDRRMLTDTIHPANQCVMERRSCVVISPSAVLTRPIYAPPAILILSYIDILHQALITERRYRIA